MSLDLKMATRSVGDFLLKSMRTAAGRGASGNGPESRSSSDLGGGAGRALIRAMRSCRVLDVEELSLDSCRRRARPPPRAVAVGDKRVKTDLWLAPAAPWKVRSAGTKAQARVQNGEIQSNVTAATGANDKDYKLDLLAGVE